ncbi:conserved hypothetical protein [Listeria monocytogenes str. 4b H7858]|nr:conserved hypothetical protein [Listeria monocytogenes str. 4b H7858] [Listeria monocytogenes serotype 4b str. H7858]
MVSLVRIEYLWHYFPLFGTQQFGTSSLFVLYNYRQNWYKLEKDLLLVHRLFRHDEERIYLLQFLLWLAKSLYFGWSTLFLRQHRILRRLSH